MPGTHINGDMRTDFACEADRESGREREKEKEIAKEHEIGSNMMRSDCEYCESSAQLSSTLRSLYYAVSTDCVHKT